MKTTKRIKSVKSDTNLSWHQKIAEARGEKWKKSLSAGKLDAQLNPSLLKLARLRLKIDQNTLAEKLDVSPSTYGSIERGLQQVKRSRAQEICKMLKSPLEKVFKRVASPDKTTAKKYVAITQKRDV